MFASRRAPLADRVADLNIGQAVELRDLPGRYTGTLNRGALVEDADRRDLGFVLAAELDAVPYSKNAREHAHIGDLLAGGTAFHFEHSARNGPIRIAVRRGKQLCDAAAQIIDAGARDRRSEEHGMH